MAAGSCEAMFDPEVIAELRRQFQQADKDGSGEIDALEACTLFARSCGEGASEEEIRKTAESLRNQLDTDRSGTISFKEYCFRFGRRYQMERNRLRRSGPAAGPETAGPEEDNLKKEREELEREREAIRQERERLQLEREREALRRERELLEQDKAQGARAQSEPRGQQGQPQALAAGAAVRVYGLQGAPELNGREAVVQSFDEASGRYIVELSGGGTKKIKGANLRLQDQNGLWQRCVETASHAGRALQRGCANVQVWVAQSGYEWWQILLGVAVVVLVVASWMQAGSRYRTKSPTSSSRRNFDSEWREPRGEDFYSSQSGFDDDGFAGTQGGYGSQSYRQQDGGRGWSFDFGGMQTYLILGGLAVLCWKGIIPVHRMAAQWNQRVCRLRLAPFSPVSRVLRQIWRTGFSCTCCGT
ncbi:unnamed protein product [Effrenium voratum]|uniref:EF-hand domain-containing protein n=1 Tax=Effrenium voratum TaxID=2562239 RepID=A0AA36N3V5_9DINO|nr:unnamed protein product [Effrenium voratum]